MLRITLAVKIGNVRVIEVWQMLMGSPQLLQRIAGRMLEYFNQIISQESNSFENMIFISLISEEPKSW